MNQIFSEGEISKFREETPGCYYVNHFNNAGAALMPKPAIDAIQQHITLEGDIGGYEAANLVKESIEAFYSSAAKLFNCKAENIAFTANATDSYTRALSSISFKKDDIILTSNNDYTSNQINFLAIAKRFGVVTKMVKNAPGGGIDLEDLDKQLQELNPKLLSITHIPTNSGLIQPVKQIGQIIKKYDTLYLLDACQSVGQFALDVNQLNCDFLSVTTRKFLRGPRGAGFLYVSDKALDSGLEPLFIDIRGATLVGDDNYVTRKDAKRFEDWECAYALMLGTKSAIDYYLEIGPGKIWSRIQYLARYARTKLNEINDVTLLDSGSELCSIITFSVAGMDVDEIKKQLLAKKINVVTSQRYFGAVDFNNKGPQWAVRISPHYYNLESEVDSLVEELKLLIKDK